MANTQSKEEKEGKEKKKTNWPHYYTHATHEGRGCRDHHSNYVAKVWFQPPSSATFFLVHKIKNAPMTKQ
jgi:ABC-type Zn2+ transport system substrate-binding protein/surface adhesin